MNKDDQRVHVRLTDYPGGWGVKTEIDGVKLPDVTYIKFMAIPDGVATLEVGMYATRPIDIEVSAKVTINVVAAEGCEVIDTASPDDEGKRMLVVRKPDA